MPYQIIWETQGVYVRHTGVTGDDESTKLTNELRQHHRLAEIRYVLVDFLACEGVSFSSSIAKELAATSGNTETIKNTLKIALVTDIPEVIALASAYLQSSMCQHEMRIYQTLIEAREWC